MKINQNITSTASNSAPESFTFDDLMKAIDIMQRAPEPVVMQEVSQGVFYKLKEGVSHLPLVKDDRYKLPADIACCLMGMPIKINKLLPDNVTLLNYKSGRKVLKCLDTGRAFDMMTDEEVDA